MGNHTTGLGAAEEVEEVWRGWRMKNWCSSRIWESIQSISVDVIQSNFHLVSPVAQAGGEMLWAEDVNGDSPCEAKTPGILQGFPAKPGLATV